jgi:hypothetical protein
LLCHWLEQTRPAEKESHLAASGRDPIPPWLAWWREDFKFSGKIGGGAECTTLDSEIVDVIIRAIQPSSRLQGYLEGSEDLSLAIVQSVIQTFFREKSATELYQELCPLTQTVKETPQEFLFRALELRQKIIFADNENVSKYDPALIDLLFRQSLETGIRDETLKTEFIAPLLKLFKSEFIAPLLKLFKSDEELLQKG